jgi:hypothetical protein
VQLFQLTKKPTPNWDKQKENLCELILNEQQKEKWPDLFFSLLNLFLVSFLFWSQGGCQHLPGLSLSSREMARSFALPFPA